MLPILSGVFGIAGIGVFILAIRTSYAIERITHPRPQGSLPRYTNVIRSAFGRGVDPADAEAVGLVKRLRILLLIVVLLMAGLAVVSASV